MSEIKVDTLTGKTTANDITVTVGASATAKLQQGLVGASGAVNTSTFGAIESNNVTSYTDRATGSVYANLSNAFASTSYITVSGSSSIAIGSMSTTHASRGLIISPDTASRVSFNEFVTTTGNTDDDPYLAFIATGDLA